MGFPFGHGNTTVAYVLTPATARHLIAFAERELSSADAGGYRLWETYLGIYLRKEAGVLNHIPVYQYGEHGGMMNAEPQAAGIRGWHQADVLWRRLAFLPAYAEGSQVRYRLIRLRGWLRGVARVITLRFFDPRYINPHTSRGRVPMAGLTISRLLHVAHTFVRHISTPKAATK